MNEQLLKLDIGEIVKLGAVDNEIYARTFFPRTFRQPSPPFQRAIWEALDNPIIRYLNELIYRGGAKTTIARTHTSKRIAYGVSKTILYVGASEGAAARSGAWLRNNVERNKLWSGTFGLSPGRKWTDTEFEIYHNTLQDNIWCMFVGITGTAIRGINFDDYRPDLIVLDDILTDENCANKEQRDKVTDLVNGSLMRSLAPRVDNPNAKIAMLVTPQNKEDVSQLVKKSSLWTTLEVGCWTPETAHLDVDQQISIWPERQPTEDLRKEKKDAVTLQKLSTFSREMEIRLVTPEQADFREEWLQYYDVAPPTANVLSIDPSPPPSDAQIAKGLVKKDPEVIHVWGRSGDNYYLREVASSVGMTPDWTISETFRLAMKYRVMLIVVESVAYQRTLAWLLSKEMQRRRVFYQILPFVGGNKYARIRSTFAGPASHGHIFVRPEHTNFISQFGTYPQVDHDDELDAGSIALGALINPAAAAAESGAHSDDDNVINFQRGAP